MPLIYYQENNKMSKRKLASDRRDEVLEVALALSIEGCYRNVTRQDIAERIGITPQAIQHHIGTMADLRRDIVRAAVRTVCLPVIAQAMAYKDPHVMKAPAELLAQARGSL